jgi:ubiquitin C-terminal hydrolase
MNTIEGIPNLGNTCYINAVIQCMRRSLWFYPDSLDILDTYIFGDKGMGIPSIWDRRDNTDMQDSHEFYVKFIDILPPSVSKHFMVEYSNDVKMPHLVINTNKENNGNDILIAPDVVCIYRVPDPKRISEFSNLEIDEPSEDGFITRKYRLSSCVCFINGINGTEGLIANKYIPNINIVDHYYALVSQGDDWYKCDDDDVRLIHNRQLRHPMYMLFYTEQ